ncbi:MAG: alpha/beta hydrolase [Spirochaetaceae bacterium]
MLEYRYREGPEDGGTCVLLHGFGADAADLYPLADQLDPQGRLRWYFPEAPYRITYGGAAFGRAWFPRNEAEIAGALEGAYFRRLSEMDPEGLRLAGAAIEELLRAVGADPRTLVLGGFSQGAMVAVEALARSSHPPADLWLFSGSAIAVKRWRTALGAERRFSFLQSHGTADTILPIDGARALFAMLEEAGGEGEFLSFDGGHGIPGEILTRAGRRLQKVLQPPR